MKIFSAILALTIFSALLWFSSGCSHKSAPVHAPAPAGFAVSYNSHMHAIVSTHCAQEGCHVTGSKVRGKFTTYSGIKPFLENGRVYNLVVNKHKMPPHYKLNEGTIDTFRYWIQAGYPEK